MTIEISNTHTKAYYTNGYGQHGFDGYRELLKWRTLRHVTAGQGHHGLGGI